MAYLRTSFEPNLVQSLIKFFSIKAIHFYYFNRLQVAKIVQSAVFEVENPIETGPDLQEKTEKAVKSTVFWERELIKYGVRVSDLGPHSPTHTHT